MYVTSAYYRQRSRSIGRPSDVVINWSGVDTSKTFEGSEAKCPLRPSARTLRRLARRYKRQKKALYHK